MQNGKIGGPKHQLSILEIT